MTQGESVDVETLRTIMEHTEDVLYMFEGAFDDLIYVNPAYEEVWGGSIEELRRDPTAFLDIVHPEDRETAVASMEELGDGEPSEVEYRVVVDGEVRWVRGRSQPIVEDGEVQRVVGWVQHVTRQKERERELERLSERYQTVYDNVQEGLFLIDVDGDAFRYADFNPRQEELVGVSADEAAGMTPEELLGEEDAAAVRERYRRCRDVGETIAYEEELDLPAGTRTFHTRLSPVTTDGEVTQIVGVARDVTERKERERALREERRLLSELLDTTPVGVVIYDADTRITHANQRAEDVLGVQARDLVGARADEVAWDAVDQDGEPLADEELPLARVLATGEPVYDRTIGVPDGDGGRRWLSVNASPLERDGAIHRVITCFTDETAEHERERELERQNERLEEFAGIVSHDLRNPLAVLEGSLDLAEETGEAEQFDRCRRAVDRMGDLIDDLLDLARHGDLADDLRRVDLASTVDAAWETVESEDASLAVETGATVRADEDRLRQLLENLLRNAVEHGGDGVAVTVGDREDGDGFYVADDGPGVPSSMADELFDAGAPGGGGTGLGLAIVAQIASAHDWRVTAGESESGGARFDVVTGDDDAER